MLINDIFNRCDKYGFIIGDKRCCRDLFTYGVVLCASTRSQLKKLLKFSQPEDGLKIIEKSIWYQYNKWASFVV